jgi:hypothetical protein
MKYRRRKLFVEPRMQGLLIFKVLLYWVNGFLTIGLLVAAWSVFKDMPRTSTELFANMWGSVGPALVASLFLLPLIVMDCIRWSNRYAGPMVRLHGALRQLADGQDVDPLTFRKGDLWCEMAEQFNRIAARLEDGPVDHAGKVASDSGSSEEAEPASV